MRSTCKRVLSLLLTLVMVFSMFPVTTLAATHTSGEAEKGVTETVDYPIWDLSTKDSSGFTVKSGFSWIGTGTIGMGGWENDPRGLSGQISGDMKLQFSFTFPTEYTTNVGASDSANVDTGIYLYPLYGSSVFGDDTDNLRIQLSPLVGLRMSRTDSINGAYDHNTPAGAAWGSGRPTSFELGTEYNFLLEKSGDTMKIYIWEVGTPMGDADMVWVDENVIGQAGTFQIGFRPNRMGSSAKVSCILKNMVITKKADVTVKPVVLAGRTKIDLSEPVFGGDAFAEGAVPALTTPSVSYSKHASDIFYMSGSRQIQAAHGGEFSGQNLLHGEVTRQADGGFKTWIHAAAGAFQFQIPVTVYPHYIVEVSDTQWRAYYDENISYMNATEGENAVVRLNSVGVPAFSTMKFGTLKGSGEMRWYKDNHITVADGKTLTFDGTALSARDEGAKLIVGDGSDETAVAAVRVTNGADVVVPTLHIDGGKVLVDENSVLTVNKLTLNGTLELTDPAFLHLTSDITVGDDAQILLRNASLAEGESKLMIQTPNGAALLAYIAKDEAGLYTYFADAAGVYIQRATSGCEHVWKDATCTAPKTCVLCGMVHGTTLEHTWTEAADSATNTCSVCGLTVNNCTWEFWKNGFTKHDPGAVYNSAGNAVLETTFAKCHSGWGEFKDNGFTSGSTPANGVISKMSISGDYSFQAQVMLDENHTWATVWPQYTGTGTNAAPSYRIELTCENGIRVGYDNNPRFADTPVDAAHLADNNTVTAMKMKTPYMLKWEKVGATLRIKFWERDQGEPAQWNFIITHEGVIDTVVGKFNCDYWYYADEYVPAVTSAFRVEHIRFTKPLSISVPEVVVDMDAQEQSAYIKADFETDIFAQQPALNEKVSYKVIEGADVVCVDAATGKLTPIKGGRARVEVTYTDGVNTVSATGAVRVKVSCTEHIWEDATCLDPSYCSVCGETKGTALGHQWKDATCTEPKTCSVCGETSGAALGHTWDHDTCSVCGENMKQLRILFFGNSYSQYAAFTMYDLIKVLDYDRLVIGNFVKGSTTQTEYWDWISGKDTSTRSYQELIKNPDGSLTETKTECTSPVNELTAHQWDYIVLQSYAPESGNSLAQNTAMANMVQYVTERATNPDMQLVYPINWSSTRDMSMYNLGSTYREVWKRVLDAYDYPAGTSPFDVAVPIGTLVEIGRGSWYNEAVGSNLTCDGYHLDPVGNYLFVMAYMTALTDQPIDGIGTEVREMGYNDNGVRRILTNTVTDAQAALCKAIIRVAYGAPHDFITYAAVTTENGIMTRYETLAEAAAAAKSGDTIEILQVCKNDTRLDIARGVRVIYYTSEGKVTAQLSGGGYIDSTGLHGTFAVDYVLNGGVNAASNPTGYSSEDATIVLAAPTRTGYTFDGWYADADFAQEAASIETGSTGDKTFYAKWTANTYTIVFDPGEGTGEMGSVSARYDEAVTLPANTFTNGSKFFAGWDTDPAAATPVYGSGAEVKNLAAVDGAVVTLYAVWTAEQPAQAYSVSVSATLDGSLWNNSGKRFDLVSETVTYGDYRGQAIVLPGTYDVYAENGDGTVQDTGVDVTVTDRNTSVTVEFVTVVFRANLPGQANLEWAVLRGAACDISDAVQQMTAAGAAWGLEWIGFAGLTGSMIVDTAAEFLSQYAVCVIDDADVKLSVEEIAAGAVLPQPEAVSVRLGSVPVSGTWTVNGGRITGSAVRGSEYVYEATFDLPEGYTMKETAVLPEGWHISGQRLIRTFEALTAAKQLRILFIGPDLSESGNAALDRVLGSLEYDNYIIGTAAVDDWSTSDAGVRTALENERWDFIVLQASEEEAAASISRNEAMTAFAAFVREHAANPNMKLGFLLSWSTTGEKEALETGWKAIADAYDFGENDDLFDLLIPVGTAIQNGRRSFWSETEDARLLTDAGELSDRGACLYAVSTVRALTNAQITEMDLPDDQITYADEQLIKVLVEITATNPVDRLTYASVNSRAYSVLNFYETMEEAVGVSTTDDLLELYGICKSSERLDVESGVTVIYYTATGKRTTHLPDGGYIDSTGLHSLSATVEEAQIGSVKYPTLEQAVEAAAADAVITLLTDVSDPVTVSKPLTILKNGFAAVITAGEGYAVEETDEAYIIAEKVQEVKFTLNGLNLRLQDLIKLGFYFAVESEAELETIGALLWTEEEYLAETDFTVSSKNAQTAIAEWSGTRYMVETNGIYVQNLDAVYYIIPYAVTEAGKYVYGEANSSSALVYANMVYNGQGTANTKSIVIDLLNYATAARTYFGYVDGMPAPEKPFNSILSEADRMVEWDDSLRAAYPVVDEMTGSYHPVINGLNTNLQEAIKLNFIFEGTISGGIGYWTEEEYRALSEHNRENMAHEATISKSSAGNTVGSVEGLYSYDIYSNFYAMAYDAEGNCSRAYGASVASYLTTIIDQNSGSDDPAKLAMLELAKAMLVYGNNAKNNPDVNKGDN